MISTSIAEVSDTLSTMHAVLHQKGFSKINQEESEEKLNIRNIFHVYEN